MKEENASYLWFACFFFFIVILILIGSFFLYQNHRYKFTNQGIGNQNVLISDKMKQEKEQDFVYYGMEEAISSFHNFSVKKAIVNLTSEDAKEVNGALNAIYDKSLSSIVKSNSSVSTCANESDLYAALVPEYAVYSYQEYISLAITENSYTCEEDRVKPVGIHAYTFNVMTGKIVSYEELLKKFQYTYTELLEEIKSQLEMSQTVTDDGSAIKIEETLNTLKSNETYGIYLSEKNKLVVKYIVKTNSVDYNDIIELS